MKNITLLMTTINNVFGANIDSYDYDVPSSTFTISFKQVLSSDQKIALDTLVNIFVDSTVLSPKDILDYKYIRAYKSNDQVLPTTLNTVTEILFKSASQLDRLYYQLSASGKFIFIQKPGIYLVIAKVGAHLAPGGLPGTNSVLQYALSYDDTKMETLYINIANSYTYTIHTNVNNMTDSTMIACVFNVTSATGTYLRLTAKQTLGNTPLVLDNDQTSISIINIPTAGYYEGNLTVAQTLTTTYTNVNMSSDRIIQYPFTHTAGTPNITVTQAGYVMYLVKSTTNKTTGTDASQSHTILLQNGTALTNVGSYSTVLAAASNKSTSHFMGLIPVAAGDVLRIQGKIEGGTYLQFPSGEVGIMLVYLHPSVLKTMSGSFVTSDAVSVPLSTSATDVSFNNTMMSVPAGYNTLGTGTTVTITTPGLYLIVGNVTVVNTSGTVRECGIYTSSSSDSGKTFYYALGSLGLKQTLSNGKVTISNQTLLNLPSNSRVKIQSATNGTTADAITTTDATQLTVICFNQWDPDAMTTVFGDNFNIVTSFDDLTVTSATYAERCRLVYYYMSAGVYRFSTHFTLVTTVQTSLTLQVIDIHTESGNTYTVFNKTVSYPAGTVFVSTHDVFNVVEGAHQFIFQLSSPNAVAFTTRNVTVDCWRVI